MAAPVLTLYFTDPNTGDDVYIYEPQDALSGNDAAANGNFQAIADGLEFIYTGSVTVSGSWIFTGGIEVDDPHGPNLLAGPVTENYVYGIVLELYPNADGMSYGQTVFTIQAPNGDLVAFAALASGMQVQITPGSSVQYTDNSLGNYGIPIYAGAFVSQLGKNEASPIAWDGVSALQLNGPTRGLVPENHPTSSAPASPAAGQIYFDTTLNKLRVWSGAAWQTITSV